MGELEGKVALITGASKGIGAECAKVMAREGADICINYKSQKDAAVDVANVVSNYGKKALIIQADVSNITNIQAMFDIAYSKFPQIDILVNNAGYHSSDKYSIEDLSEDQWNESIRVNLSSQVWCTKEVVKKMKENKWGRIINLSSITGQRGSRSGDICYTIAKIGNHGLTLGLYQQLAKYNITINTVSPGTIDTPGTHRVLPSESIIEDYVKIIPLNRIGTANEIAEMISFLSSDRAAYITGQLISINGGAWV